MKKILTACLTFSIGYIVFTSLQPENEPSIQENTSVQTLTEFSETEIKNLTISKEEKNEESLKPFFNLFEYDKEKTDPTYEYVVQSFDGWFIPDNFKGMPEVWTILLTRDSEHPQTQKFRWLAKVLTNLKDGSSDDDADFSSIWIRTENSKLSFKTKKYRHVEYRFEGQFLKNGKNFADHEKVLKGRMQKFIKGKKVAEFTADFAYFEPRCFH